MNIKFLFIGKTNEKWLLEWEEKYLKFLKKYCTPKVEILKEQKDWEDEKIKKIESERILERLSERDFLILLDVFWKEFSSEEFAIEFEKISLNWKNIVFAIPGSLGPAESLKKRADLLLSFSKFTFTHQLIRSLLFEQIFRSFSILNWSSYHK